MGDEILHISEAISRAYESYGVFGGTPKKKITSGIGPIDERMGGILAGTLWCVGARTSAGKTSLLLNMSYHAASSGFRVGFLSLEDPVAIVAGKVQSRMSSIPLIDLARDGSAFAGLHGIDKAVADSKLLSFYTAFPKMQDVDAMQRILVRFREEFKCDIIFVDYLTAISNNSGGDARSFYTSVISHLRSFANGTDIPVVFGSQATRSSRHAADNYEIMLKELAETGSIENKADVVLLLWVGEDGQRLLRVAKNKICGSYLPRMKVNFSVNTEAMTVEEIT